MNCLCCGKPLSNANSSSGNQYFGWHLSCVKKFFGTSELPDVDISEEMQEQLALESTNKGYTVPGVQKKLSLHLSLEKKPRLTLVNYPTGYILKPQTEEYRALPEAEFLIMQMAKITGIKTVPFALLRIPSQKDKFAYITRRIDRRVSNEIKAEIQMLAMEDFCQLEGKLTQDKYRGSYERCAKVISKYSDRPLFDCTELFLRIVFSFVVGNSDMHLKNFSLIEDSYGSEKYNLSPAYDLLPVNIILPTDKDEMALTLNGKKRNIRKKDFLVFAETIGLPEKSAEKLMKKVVSMEEDYILMCQNSYLPDDMKEDLSRLITERLSVLE